MTTKHALFVAVVGLVGLRSSVASADAIPHYRLKRDVYKLELSGAPLARILCTVTGNDGSSDTVIWDPEERRSPVRYALLPKAFGRQEQTVCEALEQDCSPLVEDELIQSCQRLVKICGEQTSAVYEDAGAALVESCEKKHGSTAKQCTDLSQHLPQEPAPRVACHSEPLVLKSEAGTTVISYPSASSQNLAPLDLTGSIISDTSPKVAPAAAAVNPAPAVPGTVHIEIKPVDRVEKSAVLDYSTGLGNSTRLRSLDPTTQVLNDALTSLATIALDRAKAAGKSYVRSTLRQNLCQKLTIETISARLDGTKLSEAIAQLGWDRDQQLLKNTCRLLDSLNVDELIASPDLVWKAFGMDVAELGTDIIIGRLKTVDAGHPEYHFRRVLTGARSLLIGALSDGSTTTERDAQLLILELGSLGMMPGAFAPPDRSWSNGLEIGIAVLQECLRSGPCGADLLRQGLERELAIAGAGAILESWPELPSLIGRAADVLHPPPGTPARVTAANALSLTFDVADEVLAFRSPTCVATSADGSAEPARWTGDTWNCAPPPGAKSPGARWIPFQPDETLETRLNAVPVCAPDKYSEELQAAQVPAFDAKLAAPACDNGKNYPLLKAFAAVPRLRTADTFQNWNGSADDFVEYTRVKATRDVMASLRGLIGALQGGDVATAIAGLAKMLINCVHEHCGDDGCDGFNSVKLERSFRMLAAVATYGASYRKRDGSEPAAEVEKARADERRKAMETLIDAATDRSDRQGDWVWSIGSDVALGAEWRWRDGDARQLNRNPLSLGTGIALQRLSPSGWPGHFMFSVIDLAQYASVTEQKPPLENSPLPVEEESSLPPPEASLETPKAELSTALRLGLEVGWVFGTASAPAVASLQVAWLPTVTFGDQTKSAWNAGVKLGVYIPFFDLN